MMKDKVTRVRVVIPELFMSLGNEKILFITLGCGFSLTKINLEIFFLLRLLLIKLESPLNKNFFFHLWRMIRMQTRY